MLAYFEIIQKYIPPTSDTYRIYIVHVSLVTNLALKIAKKLDLDDEQLQFIEEAAMLHDIGIVKTNSPSMYCSGKLPYLAHLTEGKAILELEGLPRHAKVAANHVGVGGLSKKEIVDQDLPLPPIDILCESIEEKIISYADLWYSKNPKKLWQQLSLKKLRSKLEKRPESLLRFNHWYEKFGE